VRGRLRGIVALAATPSESRIASTLVVDHWHPRGMSACRTSWCGRLGGSLLMRPGAARRTCRCPSPRACLLVTMLPIRSLQQLVDDRSLASHLIKIVFDHYPLRVARGVDWSSASPIPGYHPTYRGLPSVSFAPNRPSHSSRTASKITFLSDFAMTITFPSSRNHFSSEFRCNMA
jgi:hypothetical protein